MAQRPIRCITRERTRTISFRAAARCETSDSDRCRCRCGGQYHGAYRVDNVRALPLNDPHFPGYELVVDDLLLEEREWRARE